MEENKKKNETIDLGQIISQLWAKKKKFFKVWIVTFIIASGYIVSIPRYYSSEIKLAPEIDNSLSEGAIGSIASSFGFDLGVWLPLMPFHQNCIQNYWVPTTLFACFFP